MKTAAELSEKHLALLRRIAMEKTNCENQVLQDMLTALDQRSEDFFRNPKDREFIEHSFNLTGGSNTQYPQLEKKIVEDAYDRAVPTWEKDGFACSLLNLVVSESRCHSVLFSIRLTFNAPPAAAPKDDNIPF